jgi:hypothetical protein
MPDEFKLPVPQWPNEQKVIDAVTTQIKAMLEQRENTSGDVRYAVPPNVIKAMADIATNVWKAKSKMVDSASGEAREEMKRVYRHIEGVLESFEEIGLEIKDHTGDAFDYGLPLKVVTTQPTQGIIKESVTETIKPTIYWQKQIIQMGEVVIATPASTTPTA